MKAKTFWTTLIMILFICAFLYLTLVIVPNLSSPQEEDNNTKENFTSNYFLGNLTFIDDGFREIVWDYNYGGKEWKYFTMMNATCREIICECAEWGCVAYCIECSDNMDKANSEVEDDKK